jgi:exonuclease VII small subunit
MTADESLDRGEELVGRVESLREQLEGTDDPERAIEILGEVSQLAKEAEAELQRARREADARPR